MATSASSAALNGRRFSYDIETDGLLPELTRIHSLVMEDLDTGEILSYRNDGHPDNLRRLEEGVRILNDAALRVGHNIIGFDEEALHKVFPWFIPNPCPERILDTMILARLIWANVKESDLGRVKKKKLPGRLIGAHSLEAWGYRLGQWKGDYAQIKAAELKAAYPDLPKEEITRLVWAEWSQDMQTYCEGDVTATTALYRRIVAKGYSPRAIRDEMETAIICAQITRNGFPYREDLGSELYATLSADRMEIEAKLKETFGCWVEDLGVVTPKTSNVTQGYWGEEVYADCFGVEQRVPDEEYSKKTGKPKPKYLRDNGLKRKFKGYPYSRIRIVEFNPSSRHHIAGRLKKVYGWNPTEFTPSGEAKIDDEVIGNLDLPVAPLLSRYFLILKRIGQLAEGNQAWLKLVRNGRIHGSYNTVGAVTRRATHSNPNIAQVPGVKQDKEGAYLYGLEGGYGTECREMFYPGPGRVQMGADLSGIELRCLAHFMARWDGGSYVRTLLEGDIHSANQKAAGLPTRNDAKTFIYAFLYGAGDGKIGQIVGGGPKAGRQLREQFQSELPAMGKLVKAVQKKAKMHGYLNALDGGTLHVRSPHSALNTLLQSAGALIAKRWLCEIVREIEEKGFTTYVGGDVEILGWVHDEVQVSARNHEIAKEVGEITLRAVKRVEEYYSFRCPLDAEFKIGDNWRDCH